MTSRATTVVFCAPLDRSPHLAPCRPCPFASISTSVRFLHHPRTYIHASRVPTHRPSVHRRGWSYVCPSAFDSTRLFRTVKPVAISSRSRPRKAPKPAIRSWSALLIRKRAQFLGFVDAADRKAAGAAAVKQFSLSEWQRKRLVLQEAGN